VRPLLFVLAAALSAATIWFGLAPHDEGLMLQAARRIGAGELPYRDFWWNYGPGQPLLLAPFGDSLLGWRVVRVLLDATVALLAFELAWREVEAARGDRRRGAVVPTPRWLPALPLGAWLAVAGAMAFPTGPGPNPTALALGLGAMVAAPRSVRGAGVLAGLAAVFRLEIGVACALGAALLAGAEPRPRLRVVAWAAGTAILGWLPFAIAAPGKLLDQTAGFLGIQGQQRLPFPLDPSGVGLDPNKLLELWLPAILVAGTVLWVTAMALRRPPARAYALAPLLAVGLAYLLGRTDEFHLVPLAVALPLVAVAAAARETLMPLAAALLAVVALIALHGVERKAGQLVHRPPLAPVPGPAGDGVRTNAREAATLRRVLRAIDGRSIFVVPPRTDRVTVGDPLLYVLAAAENPTRYDVMQPGVVTTAKVQREIVRDLERARPAVLVRWLDPRTRPEDNRSGRTRGAQILDRYLARAYDTPPRRIGVYVLRERG
jgi:hypothetical protein